VAASVRQAAHAEGERRAAEVLAEDREQALARSKEEAERTQREIAAARDRWEAESRRSSAELERTVEERDHATNALHAERQAAQESHMRIRRVAIGLVVLVVGIAIAIALPLTVVSGKSAIAGSVIGGIAVILLGTRIVAGRDWGGEVVTWGGLLVAIAAVVVSLIIGAH
jgi:Flp pilus assembly protein TadB